jgi:hypothetical protein
MTGDWRDYRPVIWMTMVGIAVMLLVSPAYIGAIFFGFAIGAAIRINRGRRAVGRRSEPPRRRPRA